MSDYTPEELRGWCKLSGLVWMPGIEKGQRDDAWVIGNPFHDGGAFWLAPDHPALVSYVADLLVAKVRERDPEPSIAKPRDSAQRRLHEAYCRQFTGLPPGYMVATPAQRCRAAAEVLGDE